MSHDVFGCSMLAATLSAFVLLTLTTFSMPMASSLYFLYGSQAGGVRFGLWGWCLDEDAVCISPNQLGYTWEPQIAGGITKTLVFYPIAAILTLFALISLIPVLYRRTPRTDKIFLFFGLSSFLASLIAFLFMIVMWTVAKHRFQKAGFQARFGPLPWMSLAASLTLLTVTLTSWYAATTTNSKRSGWYRQ